MKPPLIPISDRLRPRSAGFEHAGQLHLPCEILQVEQQQTFLDVILWVIWIIMDLDRRRSTSAVYAQESTNLGKVSLATSISTVKAFDSPAGFAMLHSIEKTYFPDITRFIP